MADIRRLEPNRRSTTPTPGPRPLTSTPGARRPIDHLTLATRAGRHPRVVSVHSGKSGTQGSILEVSLDLGDADEQLELRVSADGARRPSAMADAPLVALLQSLAEGLVELRSDTFRVLLRIDAAATELLARRAGPDGSAGGAAVSADLLTQLLLNSRVVEAEPLAPTGYVRDGSGLYLPQRLGHAVTATPTMPADDVEGATAEPASDPSLLAPVREAAGRVKATAGASWATLCFWLAVAGVALFRYLVLAAGGAPATIDSGNWLAFAESLFGGGVRAGSISYPPAVPALTGGLVALFGPLHGVAVMGALCSVVPALGLYGALRLAGCGRERVVAAALLLGAGSVGEAAAWGGFPQLLAMGVMPLAVVLAGRAFAQPTWRRGLALGGAVMASLAMSHFVSVVTVLAVVLVAVHAGIRQRRVAWVWSMLRLIPFVIVPSVWLVPTYIRLVEAVVFHPNEYATLDNLTSANALTRLDNIYGEFPLLWQLLVPLTLLTPLLLWSQRRTLPWQISTSVLLATTALTVATQEARYYYLVPMAAAAAVALWATQLARSKRLAASARRSAWQRPCVIGLAALLVALQLHAGLAQFERQRDFYGVLSAGMVEAVDAADAITGRTDVIAVPSLDDAPVGWWVEGLTDATVVYGSPLRWLNFGDEIERAQVANAIFDPGFPDATTLPALEAASVDVLVMPRTWAWFDDEAVDAWIDDNGLDVLERNEDALAIRIG